MGAGFTREEIETAKSADLVEVVKSLGYTVRKIGNYYTLKEMDSIRIYDRSTWYRWSDGTGGSQIDFLMTFAGMDFREAVSFLLNRDIVVLPTEPKPQERQLFILPEKADTNDRLTSYLSNTRALSKDTIGVFADRGLIYEERDHHNIVFIGKDRDGVPRFASMRGTNDDSGKPFKCDVIGSDKSFGFHLEAEGSNTVRVFEGAIDLMSFYEATRLNSDHLLALGMTNDKPLARFLDDRPEIKNIYLFLDNDEPGITAAENIQKKYEAEGYRVKNFGSPRGYKDYNEWLVATRLKRSLQEKQKSQSLSR